MLTTTEGLSPSPRPSPRRDGLSRRSRVALVLLPALAATAATAVMVAVRDRSSAGSDRSGNDSQIAVSLDSLGVRAGAAPAIDLAPLTDGGPPVSLAALRGAPAVVNFFSSTCVPCRTELPLLETAAVRWAGVRFVGIDHLDRAGPAKQLVAASGVTFPVGFDPEGATAVRYQVPALPATFFLRADGTIAGRVLGPINPSELQRRLAALTAPPPAPAR